LRQSLRNPPERSEAIEELEAMLDEARANRDDGKLIPVSTLIAAAAELQGESQKAELTLKSLEDYDPNEVQNELGHHRAILRIPRRSAANSAMTFLFMFGHTLGLATI